MKSWTRGRTLLAGISLIILTVCTVLSQPPRRIPVPAGGQTNPSINVPKEINMQNPIPDCEKYMSAGLYKEAFDALEKWTLDPNADPKTVGHGFILAVDCLFRLNHPAETDEYRDRVLAVHRKNRRLLQAAAISHTNSSYSYGSLIDGKFVRGSRDGEQVNSTDRDFVQSMLLYHEAMPLVLQEDNKSEVASFFYEFSGLFTHPKNYYQKEEWKMQTLTDLSGMLPDYEPMRYGNGGETVYAPVDADGNPVYYDVPDSFEAAKNDGERWRWCLETAVENDRAILKSVLLSRAAFAQSQFGENTLSEDLPFLRSPQEDRTEGKSGIFALHTLGDHETIAKLAGGVKRFPLRDDYNYIALYKQLAEEGPEERISAWTALAHIYQNRRQFETAAKYWQLLFDEFPLKEKNLRESWKISRDQILGNWGRFEQTQAAAHGKGTDLTYVFRNGKAVTFTANEIKIPALIEDIKAYLRSKPKQLDWNKITVDQIGYRLVRNDQKDDAGKYLGRETAKWTVPLKPAKKHFDTNAVITMPMTTGGAYLVKAEMEDGNTDYIIVWIHDTAIVQKQLDQKILFYIGDAQTGAPVAGAKISAFGYRMENENGRHKYDITEKTFKTDNTGLSIINETPDTPSQTLLNNRYQWMLTAATPDGRFAYSGFNGIWYANRYDSEYNTVKAFFISDRPVYRSGDTAEYKFWVGTAKYDQPYESPFAGRNLLIEITSPRGERFAQKVVQLDAYGGVAEKIELPKDATLGVWNFGIGTPVEQSDGTYRFGSHYGGGSFRVEEYKKPEYEVTVDAPKEPVMLGGKVTAKITAKYYFGAPVTNAKVKYKVLRTKHNADWYPIRPWDWFYGNGYGWFGYDYDWYPGWKSWGCRRPAFRWFPRSHEQPEVVAEQEVSLGEDGTVDVTFDTSFVKEMFPNDDQKYEITAEVVDQSRRTIAGRGNVLVAKEPFKVYAWGNRGYYQTGDPIRAEFQTRRLDGKPVAGKSVVRLYKITYDTGRDDDSKTASPLESLVHTENMDLNEAGTGHLSLSAAQPGQYRIVCSVTDHAGHTQEGGYLFSVRGAGQTNASFRFNALELIPDKAEFVPGEEVGLLVNTNRPGSTVLLFVRPANGVCLPPQMLKIAGQSTTVKIPVTPRDMPNFFVEAVTISDGHVFSEIKELAVPPAKRILHVEVRPNRETYKPGEKASVELVVTDADGKPVAGQNVAAIYDKSVESISGGSNVGDIREFFWKWRRTHHPSTQSNLERYFHNITPPDSPGMETFGIFRNFAAIPSSTMTRRSSGMNVLGASSGDRWRTSMRGSIENGPVMEAEAVNESLPVKLDAISLAKRQDSGNMAQAAPPAAMDDSGGGPQPFAEAAVRKDFADTALWVGAIETDRDGIAKVELSMPENLTTWKINIWSMGHGTQVGYAATDVITRKDLILRMQTPRFLTQRDEILLTANVHNYLPTEKKVQVSLEMDSGVTLVEPGDQVWIVTIPANGESRINWLVEAAETGDAVVRMKALTEEESDAVQMTFPIQIHGMLKQEAFSGVIRPAETSGKVKLTVPNERIAEQSKLTVRFSPTLAGAMIDALPYLTDYPYGCTEQTLNRFLPTVITQKILIDSGADLAALEKSHANLNAQELGDPAERAKQWQRSKLSTRNLPVYSMEEVRKMTEVGVKRLTEMQLSDGGWGWFSGYGEHSSAHLTAQVVHGLRIAKQNDVAVNEEVIQRGVRWLHRYLKEQVQFLRNAELPEEQRRKVTWKQDADNIDAFVCMVLSDSNRLGEMPPELREMRDDLWRDRAKLSLYGVAMYGIGLGLWGNDSDRERMEMCLRMLEQYLEQDDENQTARLNLAGTGNWYWWCWYGSEFETQAMYLKLLMRVNPKSEVAPRLVKWLLNNRRHATYWNSTRDTALCVEAFADFLRATGESKPDMTLEVLLDGKTVKTVEITPENMLTLDNTFVLEGTELTAGPHEIELRRQGTGPVYFNAYLENFTLENMIAAAGLEVKVQRRYWLLTPVEKLQNTAGRNGQVVSQKVEKYDRSLLENLAELKSGQLVEIELIVESKNDYESLMIEDMKPAGLEPVEVRSGYNGNPLGAYVEYRDNRVTFFVHRLPQGTHSVSYRMRAEQPGIFSALPSKIEAMYAPELRGNSGEQKIRVTD
ncbi:MAG: alpha-2-macroglobulin [Planctomycetaceae bacterium]|nr:alpha-2-macroglobulin [Planctomycetaceae bacterium]